MGPPPQPFTFWSGPPKGQGWDPPTLHDLAADFLLPNSAYKIAIHLRLSADLGVPPFSPPKGQGLDPPNPSRLGVAPQKDKDGTPPQPFTISGPPKMTRIGPPNPSRLGVAPQKDKDGTPPNPLHFGAAPQEDKDGTLPPFHDLAGVPFQEADS